LLFINIVCINYFYDKKLPVNWKYNIYALITSTNQAKKTLFLVISKSFIIGAAGWQFTIIEHVPYNRKYFIL